MMMSLQIFRRKTFWLGVKTISPFQVKWSVPKMIRYLDVAIMEMRGLDLTAILGSLSGKTPDNLCKTVLMT
jgi:hypothetical protein